MAGKCLSPAGWGGVSSWPPLLSNLANWRSTGPFVLRLLLLRRLLALSEAFGLRNEPIYFADEMMREHERFVVFRAAHHLEHEWPVHSHLNCVVQRFSGAVYGALIAALD